MNAAEFNAIVKITCPDCAMGIPRKARTEVRELIHEFKEVRGAQIIIKQRICFASHLLQSHLAKELNING